MTATAGTPLAFPRGRRTARVHRFSVRCRAAPARRPTGSGGETNLRDRWPAAGSVIAARSAERRPRKRWYSSLHSWVSEGRGRQLDRDIGAGGGELVVRQLVGIEGDAD